MHRPRKHIDTPHALHAVAPRLQHLEISGEAGRLAGDIDHAVDTVCDDLFKCLRMNTVPGRVEHDKVGLFCDVV